MDQYDFRILEELQNDGKKSIAELGRIIGLSTTATKERVKKLENDDVISGYSAIINADKVGVDITVFITVPVGDITIEEMGELLTNKPEIQEVHKVTGDTCYFVKAKTRDAKSLEILIDSINKHAKSTYTYLALSTLKETSKVVIPK
ncbi:Lrp/AsnC family transcriptional regulator [Helicovermis profundi]|uniref:Lrp/AsnC family transcriptional regulator n=1 Tax=Helicovermis profundi TaxID=3065157 RepID=A0AAU9E061_9FIRM|nr:Lrp/AsnC family transcriptional regulator [Clostridia bacterium S502]